jgi:hypothetical protein
VIALGAQASEVALLVQAKQLTGSPLAVGLLSLSQNACFLLGSALGGALAVTPGPWLVYGIGAVGFATSFGLLTLLPGLPGAADAGPAALRGITGGLRYAVRRQDLLGSYLADLAAMIFAYPNALFPFLAAELHARWATGLMFAAPSVGAFGVTVLSGWMGRISRHGLAIALAAAAWGLAMAGFGPPAGQLRSGVVASLAGMRFSLVSGGFLCAGAVAVIAALLPGFIRPGTGWCPAAQGSAGHRADGVLGRPVPTQGNDVKADKGRKILSV